MVKTLKNMFFTLSLIAIVMLLFLARCGNVGNASVGQPKQLNQMKPTGQVKQPTLVINLMVLRFEFNTPTNMCEAPLIADAIAGSRGQSHWNTTNKAQPSILSQPIPTSQMREALIQGGYTIYTPIQFASMNILLDRRATKQPPQEFVMEGGQERTTRITVGGYPQLKTATRYLVVFVPGLNASTQQLTSQWQLVSDAFPIDAQGMVLLQQAGSPNEPGPGQPQPEIKMALTDLQQQLAACPAK